MRKHACKDIRINQGAKHVGSGVITLQTIVFTNGLVKCIVGLSGPSRKVPKQTLFLSSKKKKKKRKKSH